MNSASIPSISIAPASGSTECHQSAESRRYTSSSTASPSTALPTQLVQQFKPSKSFKFPKRRFGKKGEERSFRAAWCEKYDWLHYNVNADAAFCYLCM